MQIQNAQRAKPGERETMSVTTGAKPFGRTPVAADVTGTLEKSQADRQPDGVEAPAVEATPKDEKLSSHYANLARKEKALRAEQERNKAEKASLDAQRSEYQTNYVPKNQLKDLLLKDPTQFGITAEDLLNAGLNGPTPQNQENAALHKRIEALENQLKQTTEETKTHQNQAYEGAVNQIRSEAKLMIDSDPRFETVKERKMEEAIVELITQTWNEQNKMLSVEDAATEIENYLIEEGVKFANLPKVKQKLSPPVEIPAEKPAAPQKPQMKTLTHSVSTSGNQTLTDKQRRERAVAAFRGQLQS